MTTIRNPILSQFLDTFALSPLNTDPTCFKNSKDPCCSIFCLHISNLVL